MADMHPNAQVVLRGFQAFAEGDIATMKSVMADDVVWHTGGRNRWSGEHRGVDAVLRLFGEITAEATIENELHAVLADDDHVVVLVNGTASRGDQSLSSQTVFIFHVEDGKMSEAWGTPLDPYAVDDFWA